jgi:AhpD family alkylhydroperoxidase
MQPRIDFRRTALAAMQAMLALQSYVNRSGLPPSLLELVKIRASQINACAYCLDMHTKDAKRQRRKRTAHLRLERLARNPILQ